MTSPLKNIVLGVFAISTVVLAVLLMQTREQLALLEQTNARTAAANKEALKQAAKAEERLAETEKDRDSIATELKTLREAPKPAPTAASNRRRDPAAAMAMLDNPAMQKVMAGSIKRSLDQRYATLFRKLKLSPADLDKFKDLLVEKQMSGLDVMRAAQSQGLNPATNPTEFSALMAKAEGEANDSIHTLLGDQSFGQFQDYSQNIGSYGLLDQIEQRLSYTNVPLESSQSEALLRVLSTTAKAPAMPGASNGGSAMASLMQSFGSANPMLAALTQPRITDQTIESAQGVLNPAQIEVLKQIQTEQQNQAASMQSLRGNMPFAQPGSTPTAPPSGL